MSNNAPDYENNLAFDPDINTMPRCDIEDLKKQLETANFYHTQNAEYIQRLEEENAKLKKQNIRLRGFIKTCLIYIDNQSVTDAWASNIKMDIMDAMGDLDMENI